MEEVALFLKRAEARSSGIGALVRTGKDVLKDKYWGKDDADARLFILSRRVFITWFNARRIGGCHN